jgi:hypothetical protein
MAGYLDNVPQTFRPFDIGTLEGSQLTFHAAKDRAGVWEARRQLSTVSWEERWP